MNAHDTTGTRGARRPILLVIGGAVSLLGTLVFIASALTMIVMWVRLVHAWMGWAGVPVGILTSPTAVVYPILRWLATGTFPGAIFIVWATGIAGLVVSMLWAAFGRPRAESAANDAPAINAVAAEDAVD